MILTIPQNKSINMESLVRICLGARAYSKPDAVLVLAYLAGSVSYEEIYSVYGELPGMFRKKIMYRLVKKGMLDKKTFSKADGAASTYYICTKKGAERAKDMIWGSQRCPSKLKQEVGIHAYAVGYNLFQLIRLYKPFKWYKESPYDNPEKEGMDYRFGTELRTDCVAIFKSGRIVRIEEDRASENTQILYEKLLNYENMRCLDNAHNVIVFSIKTTGVSVPAKSARVVDYVYSKSYLKELILCLEENRAEFAHLLIGHPEMFPRQGYLKKLLKRLSYVMEEEMVDIWYLKDMFNQLNSGICTLQQEEFNKRYIHTATSILKHVADYVEKYALFSGLPLYLALMKGCGVGFTATTLLSVYLPWLMIDEMDGRRRYLEKYLSRYYGSVSYEGEFMKPLHVGDYKNTLIFRNSFRSWDGAMIAVEYPAVDLGAWVRCREFVKHVVPSNDTPVQVVCVINEGRNMKDFFDYIGYDALVFGVDKTKPLIYGITETDLNKGEEMFTYCNKLTVPVPFPKQDIL